MGRRQPQGLDLDDLYRQYPILRGRLGSNHPNSKSEAPWDALFAAHPDAVHKLFADLIKASYATPGRVGQRPMPREEEVDLRGFLQDDYTDRPISEVLPGLIQTSRRQFAGEVGLSWTTFRRLLSGEYVPDPSQIRRIAKRLNRSPLFFIEYRRMMLIASLVNYLEAHPNILNSLVLSYVEARTVADPGATPYEQRISNGGSPGPE